MGGVIQIYAVLLEEFPQADGCLPQLVLIPGGQRENQILRLSRFFFRLSYSFVMLKDDVGVRSARAERANSSAEGKPRAIHLLVIPLFQTLYDVERGVRKIDELVQLGAMQGRRKLAMLHLQKRLAYADDACRRFQVAYIAFDRADGAGLIFYGV